ncbi:MAG: efflux RND transporter periplasmic adaptor subunit [Fimbriimonadaceae bacterium]|nr:efflux RND transporter periplasmic adaptor subunit [Fimbriimonadaceae bacterium]
MTSRGTILVLGVLLVAGCGNRDEHPADEGHGSDRSTPPSTIEVDAGHVEGRVTLSSERQALGGIVSQPARTRTVEPSLDLPGTVESTTQGRAVVTPPVAGRVVSITVTLGDSVRRGQTLAMIESAELAGTWSSIADAERGRDAATAALAEARSEESLANAKLAFAKASLARQRELATAGAFSQAPLQQAQIELSDAQSELLSVQQEQASHAEVVRRLESLYRDGIVSRADLEAARLELQQDVIRLERAGARIANAKATYDRERLIAGRGLLNARELQAAEAEVRSATLEVERARARNRAAAASLSNAARAVANAREVYRANTGGAGASVGRVALTAPISGIVTHLDVTRGQAVDRTQALLEVENLASVWVTAMVPERDASRVQSGAAVEVSAAALKGGPLRGVVQVVGSRIEPKSRGIPIRCLVADSGGRLKPGMFATVRLAVGRGREVLAVSASSIVAESGRSFVFVQNGELFMKTEVSLGERTGDAVEVRSGISLGDRIVTKGTLVLVSELKKDELKGHDH